MESVAECMMMEETKEDMIAVMAMDLPRKETREEEMKAATIVDMMRTVTSETGGIGITDGMTVVSGIHRYQTDDQEGTAFDPPLN